MSAGSAAAISYRNLPLPRYHLDPVLENGGVEHQQHNNNVIINNKMALGIVDPPNGYGRPFTTGPPHLQQPDLRYHVDVIDRHNDSGYSTRPGESSQGPSPSLSGRSKILFF